MEIIFTKLHHGRSFSNTGVPTYVTSCVPEVRYIDKNYFFILELLFYTKELGYEAVRGFYYQDAVTNQFKLVKSDRHLYELVKDLKHEDSIDFYVYYVLDEPIIDTDGPTSFLHAPDIIECANLERENVGVGDSTNIERESVEVEKEGEADVEDIGVQGDDEADVEDVGVQGGGEADVEDIHIEDINLEDFGVEGGDEVDVEDINVEDVNRLISELSYYLSSDSDLRDIPSEDGSDVDEELRDFRQERREKYSTTKKETKKQEKRLLKLEKYMWKFLVVSIEALGILVKFRKAIADYVVEYRRQVKLKPNEKHRIRVKCISANCNWLLFSSTDSDSGDFIVKNYNPIHKCIPLNKNKMCDSKLVARKFKDRIASQSYIRIWEIQDLVREVLGLYVGKTICYRAKQIVMRKNMGDWKLEFSRLCDYADMIKTTNPGSSCWIKIDKETEPEKNLFGYFYVCFHAFKQGWLDGSRKIIGFDGCFFKGSCKGELLVAVGENGNNQMYPIAWAVMDTETKHSWDWFTKYLIADLNLGTSEGLTDIRHQLMNRHVDMIKFTETWISDIAPMARTKLEANKEYSNRCRVLLNGVNGFEIEDGGYTFVVHLDKKYCDCRLWMLRGIPCPHAICAYYYLNIDPGQHVEHWYNKETFLKSYSHFIQLITNMRMWPETKNPSIEPPKPRNMSGKPVNQDLFVLTQLLCQEHLKERGQGAAGRGQGAAGRGQGAAGRGRGCSEGERGIGRGQGAAGRGQGAASIGKGCSGRDDGSGSGQFVADRGGEGGIGRVPPLPTNKRSYNATSFTAATGYKRPATGFGVYSDLATGTTCTSSERVLYGGINLRSASPTNIDIGFKPSGLKWNGKDTVTSTQLQQMKANKRKKVEAAMSSSSIESSKK
ncbi:putative transcription factor MYC2-like [Capsicum annuum]|nr:putative transcription factor MYC2-like [Capsicum annuum]KAF3642594.1 putative transcription factor MYC2-like [Capsicum annuum]